jgi:hypothetical protein
MNVDPAAIDAKSIQQYAAKAHDQGVVDDAKKWSRRLSEKRQGEGEQQREEQHLQDFTPGKVVSRFVLELLGAVSGRTRILDQAARSSGVSASLWFSVCHPSSLRMVI